MFDELLIMPRPVVLYCLTCQKPLSRHKNAVELYHDGCWQPVCQSCAHQLAPKLNLMLDTAAHNAGQKREQRYILPNIGVSSFGSLSY